MGKAQLKHQMVTWSHDTHETSAPSLLIAQDLLILQGIRGIPRQSSQLIHAIELARQFYACTLILVTCSNNNIAVQWHNIGLRLVIVGSIHGSKLEQALLKGEQTAQREMMRQPDETDIGNGCIIKRAIVSCRLGQQTAHTFLRLNSSTISNMI